MQKISRKCAVYGQCGGCRYPHEDYRAYLEEQQKRLASLFSGLPLRPIVPMEDPFYYRGKIHGTFRYVNKRTVCGLYQEDSHRIVPITDCLIEDRKAQEIRRSVLELARSFRWPSYDEKNGRGLLRHVLLRSAPATGEVLVCLVVTSPIVPGKAQFAKALMQKHPEVRTVVLSINDKAGSMVLGEREVIVRGPGAITDQLMGMVFRVSAGSFYQVNTRQTAVLYKLALEAADFHRDLTLLDAYCGVGTIGILAAAQCKQVISVELNPKAVRDAIANARLNRVKNITFEAGDAADFLENCATDFDRIIVDPPRSGLDPRFINSLLKRPAARLVYISCNPISLADNLAALKNQYNIDSLQPVDMFPWTGHVECIALLSNCKHMQKDIFTTNPLATS